MLPAKPLDIPAGYALAGVKSFTLLGPKDGHMVVVRNGKIVHDPNPRNWGRSSDEYEVTEYWAFTCIDASKQPLEEIANA